MIHSDFGQSALTIASVSLKIRETLSFDARSSSGLLANHVYQKRVALPLKPNDRETESQISPTHADLVQAPGVTGFARA